MMGQILPELIIGVAVSGAFAGHLFIRSRERERWKLEERRQRATQEHEWQPRHRDDQLKRFKRFLSNLSQIKPKVGTP
jgi:hypothetical protein